MKKERVLVVDDEEMNLFIIEEFLAEEGLDLELFPDPVAAWDALLHTQQPFDLVVLDRMMPKLDGMEFLRRLKAEERLVDIPVIMQTAASTPQQIREGLDAGAYYYLTKPYEPEALVQIVRSALDDLRTRARVLQEVGDGSPGEGVALGVEERFSTLEDVSRLVPLLAALCPQPETVAPGLADLLVNAVEHGNLGVTYKEKALLKWEGQWEAEITRRLALPQFCARFATVRCERFPDRITFTIIDQGEGFDWKKFLDFDPERAFDPNGRGIAMAKMMSFGNIEYRGRGNEVVATVFLGPPSA
ncbi:MAG: response regulator [Azonexus sp.]|nr:response regulator [Betaproteobacteria bacterium]MBK8919541.1 response regulator [Betaproteobacteria bacterium]MBP6036309.1 response regulator [Azonexus sp.]MBP6906827.1 response regulator [Azonexus sp.]